MNVADLRDGVTVETARQVPNRQRPDDEIQPARLNAPSVDSRSAAAAAVPAA